MFESTFRDHHFTKTSQHVEFFIFLPIIILPLSLLCRKKNAHVLLPPANEVCEGYVFTTVCLSTGGVGHAWFPWGSCMVTWGSCVVTWGHAWFPGGMHGCWGACMVTGGHAWLMGGMCGCLGACMVAGGMHDCQGACIVAGGMCGEEGGCVVKGGHAW